MNILFLMKCFEVGGQEVVTSVLVDYFCKRGNKVIIVSFKSPSLQMIKRLPMDVSFYVLDGFYYSKNNINALQSILINHQIEIVINQWGLPYLPALVINKAGRKLQIKKIAVYHNDPSTNARLKKIEDQLNKSSNFYHNIYLHFKWYLLRLITGLSMRYVYHYSDAFLLLSESFIYPFKKFAFLDKVNKVHVVSNPLTVYSPSFKFNVSQKQKEILYVGRIDDNQKKVHRVIDTWALLERKFPEWQLTLVGDGIEKENLEKKVIYLGLKHVSFEGFQNPIPYYERASLLMLTSDYEGFPLVLAECMSFGVIPVVYGSYSAVYDIIKDKVDGFILPYQKTGYDTQAMASRMATVMQHPELYQNMAKEAIETSKSYSLDIIYQSWEKLFKELKNTI